MPASTNINDAVRNFGAGLGIQSYDHAYDILTAGYTPNQIASYGGATDYNQGVINLANTVSLQDYGASWNAAYGTATTVPNNGTLGAALDITNTGMIKVDGPCFYVPSISSPLDALTSTTTYSPIIGAAKASIRCRANLGGINTSELGGRPFSAAGAFVMYVAGGSLSLGINGSSTQFYAGPALPVQLLSQYTWYRIDYDGIVGLVEYFYSSDGISWTSQGSQAAITGGAVSSANTFSIGECFLGQPGGRAAITHFTLIDNGTVLIDIRPENVPNDTEATSFVSTDGRSWTFTRATSGVACQAVPAGKSFYFNPDPTGGTNLLGHTVNNAGFIVAPTDDAIGIWVGVVGNNPAVNAELLSFNNVASNRGIGLYKDAATSKVGAYTEDSVPNIAIVSSSGTVNDWKYCCFIAVRDKGSNQVVYRRYDSTGLLEKLTASAATVTGTGTPTGTARHMSNLPAGVSLMAWRKGPGIAPSDATAAAIAKAVLNFTYYPTN